MEGTFLDESGILENHQQLFSTGFLSLGHSSGLQNGISERSQFKSIPCCKTDPLSPIVGTYFGKLQETQTNLQRRASEKDSQALDDKLYKRVGQSKEKHSLKPTLQLDWKSHEQNWPLEGITSVNETMLSPNMVNSTNKNQYSCPTGVWLQSFSERLGLWRGELVFHKPLQSEALGWWKGHWVGSQPTWVLGLASLQLNLLTLGKSLPVSLPVSSSIKRREKGRSEADDLSKA